MLNEVNLPSELPILGAAVRNGRLEATSWWNPTGSHPVLSVLPTTDVHEMFSCGTALGSPAACIVAKQVNYDGTRGNDGSFSFAVSSQANAFGLEWGYLLTAGQRTDTAATNGTGSSASLSISGSSAPTNSLKRFRSCAGDFASSW